MLVPVKESQVDGSVGRSDEVVEDRALINAVSAPRASDDKNFHLSDKAAQHVTLSGRQVDLFVDCGPALFLVVGTVGGEEVRVVQSVFEFSSKVHD